MQYKLWILIGVLALWTETVRAEVVTIFVDGIDFRQSTWGDQILLWPLPPLPSGPSQDRATSYLLPSRLSQALAAGGAKRQVAIRWNGDLSDTVNLSKAIAELQLEILAASRRGDRINLVTHSMGTVIGYQALKNLAARTNETGSAYKGVDHFVTLATPMSNDADLVVMRALTAKRALENDRPIELPSRSTALASASALRIRNQWINVFAVGDEIGSGPIRSGNVKNIRLVLGPRLLRHSGPYDDEKSVSTLVALLSDSAEDVEQSQSNWVTWVYTVTVTAADRLSRNPAYFRTQPQVGSAFTITHVLDITTPDNDPRAIYGSYFCPNQRMTLQFGTSPPIVLRAADFPCPNRGNNGILIIDSVTAANDAWEVSMEKAGMTLRIYLNGGVASAFSTDVLPRTPPDLNAFLRKRSAYFGVPGSHIEGRVDSVVVQ